MSKASCLDLARSATATSRVLLKGRIVAAEMQDEPWRRGGSHRPQGSFFFFFWEQEQAPGLTVRTHCEPGCCCRGWLAPAAWWYRAPLDYPRAAQGLHWVPALSNQLVASTGTPVYL